MAGRALWAPQPSIALVTQVAAWTGACGGCTVSRGLRLCGDLKLPSPEGFCARAGHHEHMQ